MRVVAGFLSRANCVYDPAMRDERDEDAQPTPEEPGAEQLGGGEQQETGEGEEPGAADLLKAATEGAKRLKDLEP